MKYFFPTKTIQSWKVACIIFILPLYGCGTEENTDTPLPPEQSTRLIDSNISTEMSFANFKNKTFSIDPAILTFSGNRIFLKLYRQGGEILFLGQINRYRPFTISVQIRLDDTQFHYELFTNDDDDTTQSGIISL